MRVRLRPPTETDLAARLERCRIDESTYGPALDNDVARKQRLRARLRSPAHVDRAPGRYVSAMEHAVAAAD
jgi:hypothetical protein